MNPLTSFVLTILIKLTNCKLEPSPNAMQGNLIYYSVKDREVYCGGFYGDNDYVAALAPSRFAGTNKSMDHPLCYSTILIKGPRCSVLSKILDQYEKCEHDDVAVSPVVYNNLVGGRGDKYGVKWDFFPEFDRLWGIQNDLPNK